MLHHCVHFNCRLKDLYAGTKQRVSEPVLRAVCFLNETHCLVKSVRWLTSCKCFHSEESRTQHDAPEDWSRDVVVAVKDSEVR